MKTNIPFATALLIQCTTSLTVDSELTPEAMQFAEVEWGGWDWDWDWEDWTKEACELFFEKKLQWREWRCNRKFADDETGLQTCLDDAQMWYDDTVAEKCPLTCLEQAEADYNEALAACPDAADPAVCEIEELAEY